MLLEIAAASKIMLECMELRLILVSWQKVLGDNTPLLPSNSLGEDNTGFKYAKQWRKSD